MPTAVVESLRVKLDMPENIVAGYEQMARSMGLTLERLLAKKLTETIGQTSQRPIYISDAERIELEKMLGHNLGSAKALVGEVGKLARVRIAGVDIALTETLLMRLRSRCPRMEPFEAYLERNMVALLEQFTQMR